MVDTSLSISGPVEAQPVEKPKATNVISEFAGSVWRSGVQRPLESLSQVTGVKTEHIELDSHQEGWLKAANVAGNVTGQLADMVLLQVGIGKLIGKGAVAAGPLEGLTARSLAINGITGGVYGGLLTPVEPGQSQWSRFGHAITDAGTFMTLGAATSKISGMMGDGLLKNAVANVGDSYGAKAAQVFAGVGDRALINMGGGAAAGLTNVQLDAMTHGKLVASSDEYVNGVAGWAVGNAIFGEASHQLVGASKLASNVLRDRGILPAAENGIAGAQAEPGQLVSNEAARTEGLDTKSGGGGGDATDAAKNPVERAKPELDLRGLKEIAESGDIDRVRKLVDLYYPSLKKAFPLAGEIEDPETYVNYLMDSGMKWEMEQLLGPVQGGLQYQVIDVGGKDIKNAGWLEHIWVADHVRESGYGSELLRHVESQVEKKGGDVTFWEWNNPDKMTPEEIAEDAKGGITTQDRVSYWGKRGAYVAVVPSTGEIAPYAQPGMDGQEEVAYLSLAWSKPGGLEGQTVSKSDYLKTLLAAHDTITDVGADATVQAYKAELDALPDQEFKFVKLQDFIKQRTEALQEPLREGDDARLARWNGTDFWVNPRHVIDIAEAPANNEVAKALDYQTRSQSPWLRTGDLSKRFPTLKGETDADTVVVGSGVVGQQIANGLAEMGQKVVVLERGRVGSGTSSMMGAMNTFVPDTGFEVMAQQYGKDFAEIMQRSLQARSQTAALGKEFGDFQPVHSYNVGYSDNNEAIAAEIKIAQQFDPNARFITGGEAEKIFPIARSVGIIPYEGNLNPRKLLLGMASSGRYRTFEDSPVLGVAKARQGDGADIFTPEGVVHAKKVIFATNTPVTPFSSLNEHLVPVQTFSNIADIGRRMPGNFFDAPDVAAEKVPFSYWRQFNLPGFKPTETLVGGTAHMLDTEAAVPFEPQLPEVTKRLFGADGRDQMTAMIFTSYADGVPIFATHPEFPQMSMATGGGGTGLVGGALLTQAAILDAKGHVDRLLSPQRFSH